MNIDNKYIVDGIEIIKAKDGYKVFTNLTKNFNIKSLDELTNEKFEIELEYQKTMNRFSDWWKQNINRVTSKSISYTNFT